MKLISIGLTLWVLAIILTPATAVAETATETTAMTGVPNGAQAPNFTLLDTDGKTRSLSEFAGKWVVLEWMNYECPFIRKHYDSGNMQDLQKTFTEKVWCGFPSIRPLLENQEIFR
ncbi:MAG: redoxin domain-containing protein [Candidatus Riflebacteria bacterium]|nr:redoxin domain-containing protein [Candidatus Riflebacteria bacterium]